MSPFNRLKATFRRLQKNGCEPDSTVKEFVREYKEQTQEAVQKLNAEHSNELEKEQNLSE